MQAQRLKRTDLVSFSDINIILKLMILTPSCKVQKAGRTYQPFEWIFVLLLISLWRLLATLHFALPPFFVVPKEASLKPKKDIYFYGCRTRVSCVVS